MKNKFKDIDSIIFDLDGTLWDSTKGVADSWSEVLSKYNFDRKYVSADEIKGYMGLTLDEIGRRMMPEIEENRRTKSVSWNATSKSGRRSKKGRSFSRRGYLFPR